MTAEDGDARPLYTIQAYFDGKLTVEDFARTGEDRPTTPHDVFDETLPVVDVAAIKDGSEEQRQANIALMLQAAKSWGFFRIANHGVPLQVVQINSLRHCHEHPCCRVRDLSELIQVKQVEAHGRRFLRCQWRES